MQQRKKGNSYNDANIFLCWLYCLCPCINVEFLKQKALTPFAYWLECFHFVLLYTSTTVQREMLYFIPHYIYLAALGIDLVSACFTVCRLPSACESAHVLSGMRAGLWAFSTVLWGGIAGSGGSGSACTYVLPVAQPQLPAGHPGRLLPGWRYGLCGLRLTTTHHYRLQLQLQHQWVPVRTGGGRSCWSLWF